MSYKLSSEKEMFVRKGDAIGWYVPDGVNSPIAYAKCVDKWIVNYKDTIYSKSKDTEYFETGNFKLGTSTCRNYSIQATVLLGTFHVLSLLFLEICSQYWLKKIEATSGPILILARCYVYRPVAMQNAQFLRERKR